MQEKKEDVFNMEQLLWMMYQGQPLKLHYKTIMFHNFQTATFSYLGKNHFPN